MDIEDRARKWAEDYEMDNDLSDFGPGIDEQLIAAYLAGSAQTQADYTASIPGAQDEGWAAYWEGKAKFRD